MSSGQSAVSLPTYTQGMAGEIYGATLAIVPQTTQRLQQAILTRLGDSLFSPGRGAPQVASATNSAVSATNPGGQPTASMSSNPNVNPYAATFADGSTWGEVAYQYGNRSSDSNSGGWTSNLVQAVVGVDAYSQSGIKLGGGVSLSNTNVSASQGSGTVQQGAFFLYGKARPFDSLREVEKNIVKSSWLVMAIIDEYLTNPIEFFTKKEAELLLVNFFRPLLEELTNHRDLICEKLDLKHTVTFQPLREKFKRVVIGGFEYFIEDSLS